MTQEAFNLTLQSLEDARDQINKDQSLIDPGLNPNVSSREDAIRQLTQANLLMRQSQQDEVSRGAELRRTEMKDRQLIIQARGNFISRNADSARTQLKNHEEALGSLERAAEQIRKDQESSRSFSQINDIKSDAHLFLSYLTYKHSDKNVWPKLQEIESELKEDNKTQFVNALITALKDDSFAIYRLYNIIDKEKAVQSHANKNKDVSTSLEDLIHKDLENAYNELSLSQHFFYAI